MPHQGKTINFVDSPHPNWKPGDKLPHNFGSDKYIELLPEDIGNDLYFNAMHHDPPLVVLGSSRSALRGNGRKDMEQYVRETGEFTINLISNWFVEAANFTSGTFDAGVDEVEMCGLTPMPSVKVKAPRLKESALQLECKLKHIYDTTNSKGESTGAIIIAEILIMHVHEGIAGKSPTGKTIVDIDKYEPIARLGGNYYGRIKEVFELTRPNDEQMRKRQEEYAKQNHSSPKHITDEIASQERDEK